MRNGLEFVSYTNRNCGYHYPTITDGEQATQDVLESIKNKYCFINRDDSEIIPLTLENA